MRDIGKIQFVNTTASSVSVRDAKGYTHYSLPMSSAHTVTGRVGQQWYAEIAIGDQVYALASATIGENEAGVRITDANLFSHGVSSVPRLGQDTCLQFCNWASFPIDVMLIDTHGREQLAGTLPASKPTSPTSDAPALALQMRNDTWYAVYPAGLHSERLAMINPAQCPWGTYNFSPSIIGQTVIQGSVHPPKTFYADSGRFYPLNSEKRDRGTHNQLTRIEIDNPTHCTLQVYQVPRWSYDEVPMTTIDPRDFRVLETFVNDPLIIREASSGILLGVTRGTRGINRVVLSDEPLRSVAGSAPRVPSVRVVNHAPFAVDWVWVKHDGTETDINGQLPTLQPGQAHTIDSFIEHVFKFRPHGLDDTILVAAVTGNDGNLIEVKNRLYRSVEAATPDEGKAIYLRAGEVALFENKNFTGKGKIFHSAIPDLKTFGELDNKVSSIRVGPATALTCYADADYTGKPLEVTLDEPDLSVTGFDDQISSFQRVHVSEASSQGITSRSACTHDYFALPGQNRHEKVAVFRSTIHFPPNVSSVDIWAAELLTVEVAGQRKTIDPVRPVRVSPDMLGNIVVAIRADATLERFGTPALVLRTNTMHPSERVLVYPDLAAHKQLLNLPKGELAKPHVRAKLGVGSNVADDDLHAVQDAIQKLAATVSHTYNFTRHGVHHDRVVNPDTLEHPHWALDFTAKSGRTTLKPLSSTSVVELTKGARQVYLSPNNYHLQQSGIGDFFTKIGHGISELTHVVIHTVEKGVEDIGETIVHVGEDLVETLVTTGKDVVNTFEDVGEDLIEGNFSGAWNDLKHDVKTVGNDLRSGGENLAGDLVSGVGNLAGDVLTGIGKTIKITLRMGKEVVTFVLDHTGIVGHLIKSLLQKVGVALHKLVDLVLDVIGWNDVLHTQQCLANDFRVQHAHFDSAMALMQQHGDRFFKDTEAEYSKAIKNLMTEAPNPFSTENQPLLPSTQTHSKAREQLDWFLSKLLGSLFPFAGGNPMVEVVSSLHPIGVSPIDQLKDTLEEMLDTVDDKTKKALLEATHFVKDIVDHPMRAPSDFYQTILHLIEAVGDGAIEIANILFGQAVAFGRASKQRLMQIAKQPFHIPLLSDIFEDDSRSPWTILDLTALLIAMPATLSAKAAGFTPFDDRKLAQSSDPDLDFEKGMKSFKGWGAAYSGVHMCCTIFDPIADLAQRGAFKRAKRHPELDTSGVGTADLLGGMSLLLGGFGLIAGSPVGSPTAQTMQQMFSLPDETMKHDLMQKANYRSHNIWWLQFVMWLLNVANTLQGQAQHIEGSAIKKLFGTKQLYKTKYYQDFGSDAVTTVIDVIYTVMGIFHFVAFCQLSDDEAEKMREILKLPEPERTAEQREFLRWAEDLGITGKAIGNVSETFPEVISTIAASPLTVEASGGDSLLVAAAIDVASHPVQAGIYLDRAKKLWLF